MDIKHSQDKVSVETRECLHQLSEPTLSVDIQTIGTQVLGYDIYLIDSFANKSLCFSYDLFKGARSQWSPDHRDGTVRAAMVAAFAYL